MPPPTPPQLPIKVTYFSDILCIWAYVAERRILELHETFGDQISIEHHFISVFGDTKTKFGGGWADRGGFDGYADHVQKMAGEFEHVAIHPDVWRGTRPRSCTGIHGLIKAVQIWQEEQSSTPKNEFTPAEQLTSHLRKEFFEHANDISDPAIQSNALESTNLPVQTILDLVQNGRAFAALQQDANHQKKHQIIGSPTFVFNSGRQILYGNVGFKIIEANINELLRRPALDQASWC